MNWIICVVQQQFYSLSKRSHLMFGKCGQILKILSPINSYKKISMCIPQTFPPLAYVATLPCEIRNPTMLLILTTSTKNCWHVPANALKSWFNIKVRQTVSRLLTLTDWLTFWSLSDDSSNRQLNIVQLNVVASWRIFHHDYLRTVFF